MNTSTLHKRMDLVSRLIHQSDLLKLLIAALGITLSIFLSFHRVLFHEGWPYNHEMLAWAYRIKAYSLAIRNFDMIPIWSSEDAYGMGSAWPLLYHKLFYFVAGMFHFVTGSIKMSTLLSVYSFAFVGAWGMYKICSDLNFPYWWSVLIALSFPHLNYPASDWLVRGAFAEYAALCVGTWLLWWCVHLMTRQVFSFSLVVILFLIFLSHSVIAYYGVIAVAISLSTYCIIHPSQLSPMLKRTVIAALCFFILTGPLMFLIYVTGMQVDLGYLKIFYPTNQYQPILRYFYDYHYTWGGYWDDFTVQFDILYIVGTGIVLLSAPVAIMATRGRLPVFKEKNVFDSNLHAPTLAVVCTLFVYLFLQLPASSPFYEYVPGADFIQFPWRLLTLITVLLVVLFAIIVRQFRRVSPAVSSLVIVVVTVGSIALNSVRPVTSEWYPVQSVENPESYMWYEYWPGLPLDHSDTTMTTKRFVKQTMLQQFSERGAEALNGAHCGIQELNNGAYLQKSYGISCSEPSVIALPLTDSAMETVLIQEGPEWYRVDHERTADDPRIHFSVPRGTSSVRVVLPTILRLITNFTYERLKKERTDAGAMRQAEVEGEMLGSSRVRRSAWLAGSSPAIIPDYRS